MHDIHVTAAPDLLDFHTKMGNTGPQLHFYSISNFHCLAVPFFLSKNVQKARIIFYTLGHITF